MSGSMTSGKPFNQKMKPYLVYQYLLRHSDENHAVGAPELVGFLQEIGIEAERRSIYKDIEAINKAIWILENDSTVEEFEESFVDEDEKIDNDKFEMEKTILYDSHKKGFYIQYRKYDASDIRLISECIYSSKYISQSEAERLVDIMKEFVSDAQAEEIRTDALVTNRVKTLNKSALSNVTDIYDAMSTTLFGEPHTPEKISFSYLKYDINNLKQMVERKQGAKYTVSPYKLIINDGNYYLLAFDDNRQKILTFRVDRMKSIKPLGIPREGEEEFKQLDVKTYTQRTFGMMSGNLERIQLRFVASLLDTVVERFGTNNTTYIKKDEHHFVVSTEVEISNQFFGWLCGFGSSVFIEGSKEIQKKYTDYLDKIRSRY